MAVLLTRPYPDSQRIADDLHQNGIETLIWPLTRITLTSDAVEVPDGTDALVFSSAHAIRAFCENSGRRDLTVFCVGARTADMACAQGFTNVHAAGGNFEALVALIRDHAPKSVLYLRGRDVTGDMETALYEHGIRCTSQIVYTAHAAGQPDTVVEAALMAGSVQAITIWSRRNADLLAEAIRANPAWKIADADLVVISDTVAAPLGNLGFRRIIVASRPNATQMIAEIRAALR